MNNKVLWVAVVGLLVLGGVGAVAAVGVYNWALGPTLAVSGEITAIPIVLPEDSPATPATTAATSTPVTAATAEPAPTEAAQPATEAETSGTLTVLQIIPAESEVRFILSEVLRGQPTTVVGTTNQVAGQIAVNPTDLSSAQLGVIQVNARDLETDSGQRNRAIRNFILNTDSYEYITFTPTEIIGLDGAAQPGDTFTFQLAGDLTIRDITQPVVFDVNATLETLDRLSGTAAVTVQRGDYNLVIPNVPSVADVSEEVRVELEFVAAGGS